MSVLSDIEPWEPDAATRAQIDAANPAGSVWLAANAGSGKTRVLTDRVAWLLLDGAAPERILCLTYTKAAAGEMQNRLFARLGAWAMLPDDDLRAQITRLGAARGTVPTEQLRRARTLFARAIETPGGLKIQTIHAFCASLLRRFPLEAGVSPAFEEMDETAAARLHADVLDAMATDPETAGAVAAVARRLTDGEPSAFLASVAKHRERYADLPGEAALRDALGIADATPEAAIAAAVTADDLALLGVVRDAARGEKAVTMVALAAALPAILDPATDGATRLELLTPLLLTAKNDPRAAIVTKPVAARLDADAPEALTNLALRVIDARARIAAFEALAQTQALYAFAPAFAARVEVAKGARGWLDFDDQIARAKRLLATSSVAQWVLWKLDGGLDHILVDEAQDTSPDQWEIVRALAAEFGAGAGARADVARTIFVVGDRKQSIYGFQGADLAAFDAMRHDFAARLPEGVPALRDHALLHSFRSSPAILGLVDAVFAEPGGLGTAPGHLAFFPELPGRIDLWPVVPKPDTSDTSDRVWHAPMDRPTAHDADVVLARQVAEAIHHMIAARVPVGQGDARRPVGPGDVLILLQRRGDLFHHVVRACKARGLDLAGADRLKLSDDLAVRDLVAALSWAATPGDDLALAGVLRSPLCATDEDGLWRVAHDREGTLWDALKASGRDPRAVGMLSELLRVADILRPHELLQRLLVRFDGRRRLLGRLGPESAEAIDALLGQALAYETLEVPSLTGFLGWLASADIDLKRQAGRGTIRVMTVHGAKGLESPVVILPETMKRAPRGISGVRRLPSSGHASGHNGGPDDGPVVWMPAKAAWSPAMIAAAEAAERSDREERDRLLYVAMTRAESWLIVGAAGDVGEAPEDSWYRRIEAGMVARGAVPQTGDRGGLRLETGDWSAVAGGAADTRIPAPMPGWLERPVPPPDRVAPRIAPSALPGPKALPGEGDEAPEAAMRRGTAVHALLEHLARAAPADRAALARAVLGQYLPPRPGEDADAWLAEAAAVLDAPDLAALFAPGTLAEVPFALPATARRPAIFGTMDRVIVAPGRVTVVDFKTNRGIPADPEQVPTGLLNQMAAYVAAAEAIWPGHAVEAAILWTHGPRLMALPHDLVSTLDAAIDPIRPPA